MENKDAYQKITAATSLQAGLVQHFSYLVDTPAYADKMQKVLEQIMAIATGVELKDDMLVVHFTGDDGHEMDWECHPPTAAPDKRYPENFRRCLQKHSHIHCGAFMFDLAECCADDIGEIDWVELEIDDSDSLVCPVWDYSDCWIYHPERKNTHGDPALCLLSHESAELTEESDYNVGTLFLVRSAKMLRLNGIPKRRRHNS
jgi:hypothetical protein